MIQEEELLLILERLTNLAIRIRGTHVMWSFVLADGSIDVYVGKLTTSAEKRGIIYFCNENGRHLFCEKLTPAEKSDILFQVESILDVEGVRAATFPMSLDTQYHDALVLRRYKFGD